MLPPETTQIGPDAASILRTAAFTALAGDLRHAETAARLLAAHGVLRHEAPTLNRLLADLQALQHRVQALLHQT